ncbi:DUF4905 domain-containing protein [Dyadobacter sp. CY312]|uniref:DUF4905 domain-containing protein n=1 Tax=Dyadobacter sp. CY312 TaxID=2907303 RepID=UPI001F2A802A|nr:DUF4905 domain-containing protein [Dyadobacter sp. CY312]MCE7039807.1 DUF4905 domain-containing protein [Dyadobacter sp. CY312]
MQKLFSFRFSQNIWRILPDQDPASNLWAIELRSGEEKKVSFAVIDAAIPAIKWEGTPAGTDWWTAVTAFSYKHLFLHNYRYPDIPEPTDLLMVDGENGEMQWVLPNYLLVKTLSTTEIEVATKAGDQFRYMRCKADTGLLNHDNEIGEPQAEEIILREPIRYKEGNKYFEQLASFITDVTGGKQPMAIDYLEKRPYMMFSYYIYEQEKIAEYLLIITDKKEFILHEKLSEGRDGTGQSTMLLRGDNLVFLRNNNEFTGLTLYC